MRTGAVWGALLMMLIFGTNAYAEDLEESSFKVIMPLWGPTIQADGSGMFVDLFRFVLEGFDEAYTISFVSYDEALRLLLYSDADCAYPLNKASLLVSVKHIDPSRLVETRPVLISKTYLFSRPGAPVVSSVNQMKDKVLIQIRGENYNHNFKTSHARFWNVDSEEDKVSVLLAGRGDAMLGSLPDIIFSFRKLDVDVPAYDPDFSVLDYKNALTCRLSDRTQKMTDFFNQRINQTLADGSLRKRAIADGVPELIIDAFLPAPSLR